MDQTIKATTRTTDAGSPVLAERRGYGLTAGVLVALLSIYLIAPLAGALVASPIKAMFLHRRVTTHMLSGSDDHEDKWVSIPE